MSSRTVSSKHDKNKGVSKDEFQDRRNRQKESTGEVEHSTITMSASMPVQVKGIY